jgi:hypothetical protein
MKIDDKLHSLTTIIITNVPPNTSQGTGFFYHILEEKDPTKDAQWREIKQTFLITNRHVLLPIMDGKENIPNQFTFHIRTINESEGINWLPISLDQNELIKRAKVHQKSNIDIAVVEVGDLIKELAKDEIPIAFSCVGEDDFPGMNKINVEVTDDVIIAGYPKGFHDEFNKFPIVKTGIIASRWLSPFQGEPKFLIDAKLFPGSSGSIVISKPTNSVIDNGSILISEEKQFSFLGIFSGEPLQISEPIDMDEIIITTKKSFNVGFVWYFYLIPEIINGGVSIS